MDELNKVKEPGIELDGGYVYCPTCFEEVKPHENCKCGQVIDWSWMKSGH